MSLRSIGFNATIAAVLSTGATVGMSAVAPAPVQAASLAPGDFALIGVNFGGRGASQVGTPATGIGSKVRLNFSSGSFSLVDSGESLSDLTGTPVVANLLLTQISEGVASQSSAGIFTASSTPGFISNLFLDGEEVFFDLNTSQFTGYFTNPTLFNFAGNGLAGTLRTASDSALGAATIASLSFNSNTSVSAVVVQTTAVPTPALLPALLGLGAAALRKRRGEAAKAEAETAEVKA